MLRLVRFAILLAVLSLLGTALVAPASAQEPCTPENCPPPPGCSPVECLPPPTTIECTSDYFQDILSDFVQSLREAPDRATRRAVVQQMVQFIGTFVTTCAGGAAG